jgi:hypothetical protein
MKRSLLLIVRLLLIITSAAWADDAHSMPGRIRGRVTGEAGKGLAAIEVWAFDEAGVEVAGCETAADGSFCLSGLRPGKYRVRFSTVRRLPLNGAWFRDKMDGSGGEFISLAPGQDLSGIDMVLVGNGSIFGRVVDCQGRPLRGIQVGLVDGHTAFEPAHTDSLGRFRFAAQKPGGYDIVFNKEYEATRELAAASRRIRLYSGQALRVPDVVLFRNASLEIHFYSNLQGQSVRAMTARVFHRDGVCEEASGSWPREYFLFQDLPAGKCRIQFDIAEDPEFLSCWFDQRTDARKADDFVLKPGRNRLDVRLRKYGVIRGYVQAAQDSMRGFRVVLRDARGGIHRAVTGPNGDFHSEKLLPGSYQVYFMARPDPGIDPQAGTGWRELSRDGRPLLSQWYPGRADRSGAQWIKVDWDTVADGISAKLQAEANPE